MAKVIDSHSNAFIDALARKDIQALRKIPKPDLHAHGYLSGTVAHLSKMSGRPLSEPPIKFNGLSGMEAWARQTLTETGLSNIALFQACFSAAFMRAREDGISVLDIDINIRHINFFNDRAFGLIRCLNLLKNKLCPNVEVRYIAGITRTDAPDASYRQLDECIETTAFDGIDLYGDELACPINTFIPHYELAAKKNLTKKAHVGEVGDPASIEEALDTLDLDQIQHGIRASESSATIRKLVSRETMLNICPTCNASLGFVRSLKNHPIKKLFDSGVKVSIGSDNALITNKGITEEYIALHCSGTLSAKDLNTIRLQIIQ